MAGTPSAQIEKNFVRSSGLWVSRFCNGTSSIYSIYRDTFLQPVVQFKVMGTMDESRQFVRTEVGYVPIYLNGTPVLLEQWLVESLALRRRFKSLAYRRDEGGVKIKDKSASEQWGSLVYGLQVEENWVQVGDLYLPIATKGETVLVRQGVSFQSHGKSDTVRLYLLAPEGDYYVTGTFTDWTDWRGLETQDLGESRKKLYYIDLPVVELARSQFKFRRHEKGVYDSLRKLFAGEYMAWEYADMNNRKVEALKPGSRLFTSWGNPEASEEDIVDLLKMVWTREALADLNEAMRKADEVRESLLIVTCVQPSASPLARFTHALPRALVEVLSRVGSHLPGLYLWMANLEQKNGRVRFMLPFLRQELIAITAEWPVELMTGFDCVLDAAKEILLRDAESQRLSKSWLQAALQVILHGAEDSFYLRALGHAGRVDGDSLTDWAAVLPRCSSVPLPLLEMVLRLALQPSKTPQQVWRASASFLPFARRMGGSEMVRVCACLALEEAVSRHGKYDVMDWVSLVQELQVFLDNLNGDEQLQDLARIVQQGWERYGAQPNRVPQVDGPMGSALMILAMGLTVDPSRVFFVTFEGRSAYCWLRLAATMAGESHLAEVPASESISVGLVLTEGPCSLHPRCSATRG